MKKIPDYVSKLSPEIKKQAEIMLSIPSAKHKDQTMKAKGKNPSDNWWAIEGEFVTEQEYLDFEEQKRIKRESNKKIPEKSIIDLDEYKKLLINHDWFYQYSDDYSVWKRGNSENRVIASHKNDSEEHSKLFEKYCPYK